MSSIGTSTLNKSKYQPVFTSQEDTQILHKLAEHTDKKFQDNDVLNSLRKFRESTQVKGNTGAQTLLAVHEHPGRVYGLTDSNTNDTVAIYRGLQTETAEMALRVYKIHGEDKEAAKKAIEFIDNSAKDLSGFNSNKTKEQGRFQNRLAAFSASNKNYAAGYIDYFGELDGGWHQTSLDAGIKLTTDLGAAVTLASQKPLLGKVAGFILGQRDEMAAVRENLQQHESFAGLSRGQQQLWNTVGLGLTVAETWATGGIAKGIGKATMTHFMLNSTGDALMSNVGLDRKYISGENPHVGSLIQTAALDYLTYKATMGVTGILAESVPSLSSSFYNGMMTNVWASAAAPVARLGTDVLADTVVDYAFYNVGEKLLPFENTAQTKRQFGSDSSISGNIVNRLGMRIAASLTKSALTKKGITGMSQTYDWAKKNYGSKGVNKLGARIFALTNSTMPSHIMEIDSQLKKQYKAYNNTADAVKPYGVSGKPLVSKQMYTAYYMSKEMATNSIFRDLVDYKFNPDATKINNFLTSKDVSPFKAVSKNLASLGARSFFRSNLSLTDTPDITDMIKIMQATNPKLKLDASDLDSEGEKALMGAFTEDLFIKLSEIYDKHKADPEVARDEVNKFLGAMAKNIEITGFSNIPKGVAEDGSIAHIINSSSAEEAFNKTNFTDQEGKMVIFNQVGKFFGESGDADSSEKLAVEVDPETSLEFFRWAEDIRTTQPVLVVRNRTGIHNTELAMPKDSQYRSAMNRAVEDFGAHVFRRVYNINTPEGMKEIASNDPDYGNELNKVLVDVKRKMENLKRVSKLQALPDDSAELVKQFMTPQQIKTLLQHDNKLLDEWNHGNKEDVLEQVRKTKKAGDKEAKRLQAVISAVTGDLSSLIKEPNFIDLSVGGFTVDTNNLRWSSNRINNTDYDGFREVATRTAPTRNQQPEEFLSKLHKTAGVLLKNYTDKLVSEANGTGRYQDEGGRSAEVMRLLVKTGMLVEAVGNRIDTEVLEYSQKQFENNQEAISKHTDLQKLVDAPGFRYIAQLNKKTGEDNSEVATIAMFNLLEIPYNIGKVRQQVVPVLNQIGVDKKGSTFFAMLASLDDKEDSSAEVRAAMRATNSGLNPYKKMTVRVNGEDITLNNGEYGLNEIEHIRYHEKHKSTPVSPEEKKGMLRRGLALAAQKLADIEYHREMANNNPTTKNDMDNIRKTVESKVKAILNDDIDNDIVVDLKLRQEENSNPRAINKKPFVVESIKVDEATSKQTVAFDRVYNTSFKVLRSNEAAAGGSVVTDRAARTEFEIKKTIKDEDGNEIDNAAIITDFKETNDLLIKAIKDTGINVSTMVRTIMAKQRAISDPKNLEKDTADAINSVLKKYAGNFMDKLSTEEQQRDFAYQLMRREKFLSNLRQKLDLTVKDLGLGGRVDTSFMLEKSEVYLSNDNYSVIDLSLPKQLGKNITASDFFERMKDKGLRIVGMVGNGSKLLVVDTPASGRNLTSREQVKIRKTLKDISHSYKDLYKDAPDEVKESSRNYQLLKDDEIDSLLKQAIEKQGAEDVPNKGNTRKSFYNTIVRKLLDNLKAKVENEKIGDKTVKQVLEEVHNKDGGDLNREAASTKRRFTAALEEVNKRFSQLKDIVNNNQDEMDSETRQKYTDLLNAYRTVSALSKNAANDMDELFNLKEKLGEAKAKKEEFKRHIESLKKSKTQEVNDIVHDSYIRVLNELEGLADKEITEAEARKSPHIALDIEKKLDVVKNIDENIDKLGKLKDPVKIEEMFWRYVVYGSKAYTTSAKDIAKYTSLMTTGKFTSEQADKIIKQMNQAGTRKIRFAIVKSNEIDGVPLNDGTTGVAGSFFRTMSGLFGKQMTKLAYNDSSTSLKMKTTSSEAFIGKTLGYDKDGNKIVINKNPTNNNELDSENTFVLTTDTIKQIGPEFLKLIGITDKDLTGEANVVLTSDISITGNSNGRKKFKTFLSNLGMQIDSHSSARDLKTGNQGPLMSEVVAKMNQALLDGDNTQLNKAVAVYSETHESIRKANNTLNKRITDQSEREGIYIDLAKTFNTPLDTSKGDYEITSKENIREDFRGEASDSVIPKVAMSQEKLIDFARAHINKLTKDKKNVSKEIYEIVKGFYDNPKVQLDNSSIEKVLSYLVKEELIAAVEGNKSSKTHYIVNLARTPVQKQGQDGLFILQGIRRRGLHYGLELSYPSYWSLEQADFDGDQGSLKAISQKALIKGFGLTGENLQTRLGENLKDYWRDVHLDAYFGKPFAFKWSDSIPNSDIPELQAVTGMAISGVMLGKGYSRLLVNKNVPITPEEAGKIEPENKGDEVVGDYFSPKNNTFNISNNMNKVVFFNSKDGKIDGKTQVFGGANMLSINSKNIEGQNYVAYYYEADGDYYISLGKSASDGYGHQMLLTTKLKNDTDPLSKSNIDNALNRIAKESIKNEYDQDSLDKLYKTFTSADIIKDDQKIIHNRSYRMSTMNGLVNTIYNTTVEHQKYFGNYRMLKLHSRPDNKMSAFNIREDVKNAFPRFFIAKDISIGGWSGQGVAKNGMFKVDVENEALRKKATSYLANKNSKIVNSIIDKVLDSKEITLSQRDYEVLTAPFMSKGEVNLDAALEVIDRNNLDADKLPFPLSQQIKFLTKLRDNDASGFKNILKGILTKEALGELGDVYTQDRFYSYPDEANYLTNGAKLDSFVNTIRRLIPNASLRGALRTFEQMSNIGVNVQKLDKAESHDEIVGAIQAEAARKYGGEFDNAEQVKHFFNEMGLKFVHETSLKSQQDIVTAGLRAAELADDRVVAAKIAKNIIKNFNSNPDKNIGTWKLVNSKGEDVNIAQLAARLGSMFGKFTGKNNENHYMRKNLQATFSALIDNMDNLQKNILILNTQGLSRKVAQTIRNDISNGKIGSRGFQAFHEHMNKLMGVELLSPISKSTSIINDNKFELFC